MLIDGAKALPEIADAIAQRRRIRPHHRLAHGAGTSSSCRGQPGTARSACCWPSWPSASTCACWSGPARPCPPFTPPAPRSREPLANLTRATRRSRPASRSARAPVPLPPREDGRDRRRARLRRRHRPDRRRRRPLRHRRPTRRAAVSAGTTSPPGCAARPWPTSASTSRALARADRRAAAGPAAAAGRPASAPSRSCARWPRTCTTRARAATSGSSRATCGRCSSAQRADLPREPVPVGAGDRRRSSPTSCATRRTPISGSWSCCRPRPNNGAEDTRGQLGVLVDADDGGGATARRPRSARFPRADRADPLYVHAKVAVVDDRWLTSARPTSTPTRSSTTPRCAWSPTTPSSPATRGCGCGPSTSSWIEAEVAARTGRHAWSTSTGGRSPHEQLRAPARRRAAHAPAARAAGRLAPLAAAARAAAGPDRRRLTHVPDAYDLARALGRPRSRRPARSTAPARGPSARPLGPAAAARRPAGVLRFARAHRMLTAGYLSCSRSAGCG